jgi:hypothetical protein
MLMCSGGGGPIVAQIPTPKITAASSMAATSLKFICSKFSVSNGLDHHAVSWRAYDHAILVPPVSEK